MKKNRSVLVTISRMALIFLFCYASFSKFADFPLFRKQMHFQPFPDWMGSILLVVVPATEICAAVLLIFEKTYRKGLVWSTSIMSAFTIYTAIILLHFFRYVPCSCGGVIQKLTWPQHLVFNLFFTGLAITGLVLTRQAVRSAKQHTRHSFS